MKKIIFLSIAVVAILFASLAMNTNVKNTYGSIDLTKSLQSAEAVTVWVHDCACFNIYGLSHLLPSAPIWYNMVYGYQPIGISHSYAYGWENLGNLVKPCCLWCGENNGGEPCTTYATITTAISDPETGQTTTFRRTTRIFGRNLIN